MQDSEFLRKSMSLEKKRRGLVNVHVVRRGRINADEGISKGVLSQKLFYQGVKEGENGIFARTDVWMFIIT